jgi:hypothetical protein
MSKLEKVSTPKPTIVPAGPSRRKPKLSSNVLEADRRTPRRTRAPSAGLVSGCGSDTSAATPSASHHTSGHSRDRYMGSRVEAPSTAERGHRRWRTVAEHARGCRARRLGRASVPGWGIARGGRLLGSACGSLAETAKSHARGQERYALASMLGECSSRAESLSIAKGAQDRWEVLAGHGAIPRRCSRDRPGPSSCWACPRGHRLTRSTIGTGSPEWSRLSVGTCAST